MPGFSNRWLEDRDDLDNLKPWFVEFPDLNMMALPGIYYGVGCETVDQLRRWFTLKEYQTLKGYGFNAVTLKADRILEKSDIQCVFRRTKPLCKGITIIELYKQQED
jgi:hypothetical protein